MNPADEYHAQLARFGPIESRELTGDEAEFLASTRCFCVLFSNRSGSTLLSDSLFRRGLPIPPQVEIMDVDLMAEHISDYGTPLDYILGTLKGWASSGRVGLKVGIGQLAWLSNAGLIQRFAEFKIIRIRRVDVIAQAVSLFLARETGQWHSNMAPSQTHKPSYNEAAISAALNEIRLTETAIDDFINLHKPPALVLTYEALVEEPVAVLDRCCAFLEWDSDCPEKFGEGIAPLRRQADGVNASFSARYRHEVLGY